MGDNYIPTTLIRAFTFTNLTYTPIICEFPMTIDAIFRNFHDAVRVLPKLEDIDEIGLDRNVEEGHDYFEIHVKAPLSNYYKLIEDLREGCRKYVGTSTSEYAALFMQKVEIDAKRESFYSRFLLSCSRTGAKHS